MADEYIKREDAEKCAEEIINHPIEDGFRDSIEILSAIHNVPAADVRHLVHGRWKKSHDWEEHGKNYYEVLRCSACRVISDHETNFCPYCGAYMRNDETAIL